MVRARIDAEEARRLVESSGNIHLRDFWVCNDEPYLVILLMTDLHLGLPRSPDGDSICLLHFQNRHSDPIPKGPSARRCISDSCCRLSGRGHRHIVQHQLFPLPAHCGTAYSGASSVHACKLYGASHAAKEGVSILVPDMDSDVRSKRVLPRLYAAPYLAYLTADELVLLVRSRVLRSVLGLCRRGSLHHMSIF
jgi:hypothetical protein